MILDTDVINITQDAAATIIISLICGFAALIIFIIKLFIDRYKQDQSHQREIQEVKEKKDEDPKMKLKLSQIDDELKIKNIWS